MGLIWISVKVTAVLFVSVLPPPLQAESSISKTIDKTVEMRQKKFPSINLFIKKPILIILSSEAKPINYRRDLNFYVALESIERQVLTNNSDCFIMD